MLQVNGPRPERMQTRGHVKGARGKFQRLGLCRWQQRQTINTRIANMDAVTTWDVPFGAQSSSCAARTHPRLYVVSTGRTGRLFASKAPLFHHVPLPRPLSSAPYQGPAHLLPGCTDKAIPILIVFPTLALSRSWSRGRIHRVFRPQPNSGNWHKLAGSEKQRGPWVYRTLCDGRPAAHYPLYRVKWPWPYRFSSPVTAVCIVWMHAVCLLFTVH